MERNITVARRLGQNELSHFPAITSVEAHYKMKTYGMRKSLISDRFFSIAKKVEALKVSIRFFTSLREIVGKREETLEFSKTEKVTVNCVLETLAKQYGKTFVDYVYDAKSEKVKGFLQFLVNGQSTASLNGQETQLEDGDVLAIIPPVGGG
jgi:MoaD family protein